MQQKTVEAQDPKAGPVCLPNNSSHINRDTNLQIERTLRYATRVATGVAINWAGVLSM